MSYAGIIREEVRHFKGTLRTVLSYILVECNFEDNPNFTFDHMPLPLKRGQLITSRKKISEGTGLTEQQIRSVCGKLEKLKIITKSSTNLLANRASLISVINIDKFLHHKDEVYDTSTNCFTDAQPTPNQPITTNKNDKEVIKNDKQNIIVPVTQTRDSNDSLLTDCKFWLKKFNDEFKKHYRFTDKLQVAYKNRRRIYSRDELDNCIAMANLIPFYRGENNTGWAVSPEWIIKNDENPQKILNYDTSKMTFADRDRISRWRANLSTTHDPLAIINEQKTDFTDIFNLENQ